MEPILEKNVVLEFWPENFSSMKIFMRLAYAQNFRSFSSSVPEIYVFQNMHALQVIDAKAPKL
jgi:hypothetical protein